MYKRQGRDKSLASLHKATDTLSTMLAQEVKELNARQKAQRGDVYKRQALTWWSTLPPLPRTTWS